MCDTALVVTTRASAVSAADTVAGEEMKGPAGEGTGAATVAEGLEVRQRKLCVYVHTYITIYITIHTTMYITIYTSNMCI